MIHELAISPEQFDAVAQDIKPFAVCKNDKPFKVGDVLLLCEWEHEKRVKDRGFAAYGFPPDFLKKGWVEMSSGRETRKVITYILDDPDYVKEGYVILGLAPVKEGEKE